MTERDVFEARLQAAVHGYVGRVSSDLDPVELANRIAVTAPRGHRRAAIQSGGARLPSPARRGCCCWSPCSPR